jgi:DNA-binding NarL/FixJ family response regulator
MTDTTKEKDRTASPETLSVVANTDSATIAWRPTLTETSVGPEGKPGNKPQKVTTTITKVTVEESEATSEPIDSKTNNVKCVNCKRVCTKTLGKRKLEGDTYESLRKRLKSTHGHSIAEDEYICNRCYLKNRKDIKLSCSQSSADSASQQSISEEVEIENDQSSIKLKTIDSDEHHCLICSKNTRNRLPRKAAVDVYLKTRIYLPKGIRCCTDHLDANEKLKQIPDATSKTKIIELIGEGVKSFIDELCETTNEKIIDLESSGLNNDIDCKTFTGFSKEELDEIMEKYIQTLRTSENRSIFTAVTVYLTKLRTGMTNKQIASLMKMTEQQIRKTVSNVRKELMNTLVKTSFGIDHIERETLKAHISPMVKELHCDSDEVIPVLADGTYAYIQKSNDNKFQRLTYSVQKGRHLVKPFVLISSDGWIIDIFGPYPATYNDAKILELIMESHSERFKKIFKKGDKFIVDRGFRNAKIMLEEKGYIVAMPTCLPPKRKIMTREEANHTRLITKVRYKIEVINGKLKQFRLLDRVRPNIQIHSLPDDWKIAGALINEFFEPIESDKDDYSFIAAKMKARLEIDNSRLIEEADKLDRKTLIWTKMNNESLIDFPRLSSIQEIRYLTLGSYQIKQGLRYTKEHISKSPNKEYDIEWCNDPDRVGLIRVKIQSRHISSKTYNVYIDYEPNGSGIEAIKMYMCRCPQGLRTIGTCSHTTGVIMYLGYGRHKESPHKALKELEEVFNNNEIEEIEESD